MMRPCHVARLPTSLYDYTEALKARHDDLTDRSRNRNTRALASEVTIAHAFGDNDDTLGLSRGASGDATGGMRHVGREQTVLRRLPDKAALAGARVEQQYRYGGDSG